MRCGSPVMSRPSNSNGAGRVTSRAKPASAAVNAVTAPVLVVVVEELVVGGLVVVVAVIVVSSRKLPTRVWVGGDL